VFLAEDTQLQREVAVKLLHDALAADLVVRRRFSTEARAAAALNHPHLLAVYDVGEQDGVPYLVTEYLSGGSLRALLDGGHRLSLSQALLVGLEGARGLEHAHKAGLVHRDIKPANLLFGSEGRLRIADFGLAKVLAEAALTEPSGSPLGTARYLSPEQARGDAASPASDVYALALVLVEAVTGTAPFASDHPVGGLVSRTERSLSVPSELGPLRGPLERAGRLDPAERPDAGELAVALLAAAEELPRPAPLPLVEERSVDAHADTTALAPEPVTLVDAPTQAVPAFADEADPGPIVVVGDVAAESVPGSVDEGVAPSTDAASRSRSEAPPVLYDQALEQAEPEARRGVALVVTILLLLVIGGVAAFVWWQNQPVTHEVPELVGEQRDRLDAMVGDFGWEVEVRETRVDGTEPGEIVSQEPAPGTELEEGEALVVTVSLGNTLVDVPAEMVGRQLDEVRAEIEDAGLVVGGVDMVHDEDAPEGQVLDVTGLPGGATQLPKGSRLELTVSDGPAPRAVPEVAGMTRGDAVAAIRDAGLEVEVREEFSREVDAGIAIDTDPAQGTSLERDTVITLVVSKGPPLVEVPDVSGMSVDDATAELEDAGLVVGGVEGRPNRDVRATDPEAGEEVQEGTEITLITREPDTGNDDEGD
jgi:serine/threonine-protein kinase